MSSSAKALPVPGGTPRAAGLDGRRALLVLLLVTQFLVVLLDTATVLALPRIQADLGFSSGNIAWVQTAFMVSFGGPLLLAGRCADIFSRRGILVGGLALFTVASALCGLAGSPAVLIVGRVLQGLASAMASAAALSIITVTFARGSDRDTALGAWGLVSGFSATIGLLLGGAFTEWLGWNWMFLSLVPLAAGALIASLRLVPVHHGSVARSSLDLPGALLGTLAVAVLVFSAGEASDYGWLSARVLGGLGVVVLTGAAFVIREAHVSEPILPLGLLRTGNVGPGNLATLCFGAILLGMFALSSIYLQVGRGLSAVGCGAAMLTMGVPSLLLSVGVARQVGRFGTRIVLAGGLALLAAGAGALALVAGVGWGLAGFLPASAVFGIGTAGSEVSSIITSTDDLGHGDAAGVASGLWNTSMQVGGAVGLAVLATVMTPHAGSSDAGTVVAGYRDAALVACGIGVAGALTVLATVREQPR